MSPSSRHPLIPPRAVEAHRELPELELEVLERWRARSVFAESLALRADAERWVFYEGPPTANGRPGSHHVLSRVFKDIYPRFKTMRGYRVERKGGWDCHGLPVEIAVEQELGLSSKKEVEDYGIEAFNAKCRESVFAYLEDWDRLTERIGFWIDLEHAYRTLDESYIESVWWALSQIDAAGLLYQGDRVVPYCYRCGTALSSHEVAQGYEDVVDPSVYVRVAVAETAGPLQRGDQLLVWTTTPWTLPGNVAIAAGAEIEYARVRHDGETLVLAAELVAQALGSDAEVEVEVLARFRGAELAGVHYEGPIFPLAVEAPSDYPIVCADFVSAGDGTGLVHIAPAFGEDDFDVLVAAGPFSPASRASGARFDPADPQMLFNPVRLDGTYDERVSAYAGRTVKDPALTEELLADLDGRGMLYRRLAYEHSYPHCWRCGTPLIYYAKASWYIRTTALRERMLAANESVSWHPPHIKHGRFGDWLSGNVDWALSRERYWGTPLPVWRCDRGHGRTIGSFAELERLSGKALADHHRPYVDEVEFPCEHEVGGGGDVGDASDVGGASEVWGASDAGGAGGRSGPCGLPMRRVPEVIDVWFDSGAMPFAQHHAPFEHERELAESFPADFVCEALDQTRGWFYSLLAISSLLAETPLLASSQRDFAGAAEAGGVPYKNVVCLGLILDADGQKMSKSRGNTVEPWRVLDRFGADAFRWYFFTSKQPWDGYRFSEEAIGEGVRLFLKQLWSTYFFYVLYAHANEEALRADGRLANGAESDTVGRADDVVAEGATVGGTVDGAEGESVAGAADLDAWARSRTAATAELVAQRLDDYDATSAGRAIAELVDELSNWYVRRSRRRFWDGDVAAFETLRDCLVTIGKLLAPFCPFIADEIYDNLDGALPSVHLTDFPSAAELGGHDAALEAAMATARQTVRLGLGARAQAKIKVRQPLAEAAIVADGRERAAIERLAEIVREELNVRALRFVDAADELGRYEAKANYRRLGPIFGKDMPLAAAAIAALEPAEIARISRARDGEPGVGIFVAGREHILEPEDVIVTMVAPEGYSVEREGAHAVALELAIDEDLKREGYAREIVHAVQNARKQAGLEVEDRIALVLGGPRELIDAASAHEDYVKAETLAVELLYGENGSVEHSATAKIEGGELAIGLSRR
ncbi:MAG: isoleucine--tRNA ligase [Solirubrobacteraceae bacterium]